MVKINNDAAHNRSPLQVLGAPASSQRLSDSRRLESALYGHADDGWKWRRFSRGSAGGKSAVRRFRGGNFEQQAGKEMTVMYRWFESTGELVMIFLGSFMK
jgi:hypothetical protein